MNGGNCTIDATDSNNIKPKGLNRFRFILSIFDHAFLKLICQISTASFCLKLKIRLWLDMFTMLTLEATQAARASLISAQIAVAADSVIL